MSKLKILGIIPSRMKASRFPNKPMVKILGIPMVAHCFERGLLAKLVDEVYVATCDKEIFDFFQIPQWEGSHDTRHSQSSIRKNS